MISPIEIQIAHLIKEGKTTKKSLAVKHILRQWTLKNIRAKLGIKSDK